MELIKPFKPYLEKRFAVVADRADLYAYFFEQGVRLLKEGVGRLGYISSASFFRSRSGEPLRQFLSESTALEKVVDFGDLQIFKGVTTYPAIVCLRKRDSESATPGPVEFAAVKDRPAYRSHCHLPRTPPNHASVGIETPRYGASRAWGHPTFGSGSLRAASRSPEVYGPPLYGIKTGFNPALVVDRENPGQAGRGRSESHRNPQAVP